tara:strand:+ start:870 stop:1016 length:147 start_codon:yes stop_codon:yes gene_type:complete
VGKGTSRPTKSSVMINWGKASSEDHKLVSAGVIGIGVGFKDVGIVEVT